MTSDELLIRLRTRETAQLRLHFPDLSERELMQLLGASPQHAAYILQRCFGCDAADAKAAWNDYVLRYVDGPQAAPISASIAAARAM